jgi:RHS repeat-associated protein
VVSESGSGAEATTTTRQFGYDLAGRITSVNAPYGTENFVYNDRGELYAYSHPSLAGDGDATYVNQYDALGRPTVRSGAAGTTSFGYDTAGAVTTATDSLTGTTRGYSYDSVGRLSKETDTAAGGAVAASYTFGYDSLDRPLTETGYDGTGTQTGSIGYGWDANGNLTSTSGTGKLAGQTARSYRYDADNRLISAVSQGTETDYGWDGAGNRTSVTTAALSGSTKTVTNIATARYDQRNRLIGADSQQVSASYQWTARGTLAAATSTALPEGSPITVTTKSDAFDQLVNDGSSTNMYDALGRLVLSNYQNIEYDGLGREPVSDGQWLYARDLAENPVGAKSPAGQTSSLLTNVHGDVIGAADPATGAGRGTQSFGPFGEPLARSAGLSPLGFQGGWTAASGKVGARSRWYDPTVGGFLASDSAPGPIGSAASANLYGYGAANPTSRVDPTGHDFLGLGSVLDDVSTEFDSIVSNLGDVAERGSQIISEYARAGVGAVEDVAGAVADAAPEVAEAVGEGLVEAGIDIAAGAACVVGCLEALVVGAVIVVVVAGVYYAMQVNADGSLSSEGTTTSPGTPPAGQVDPVGKPDPKPDPPTSPKPQIATRTTVSRWTDTSTWYDDTYLYTRTDKYVRTTTTTYVNGVQSGAPSVTLDHTWTVVWQLLIDTSNPIPTPVPVAGPAQQPIDDQGNADPHGTCGAGGTPATCVGGASGQPGPSPVPQTEAKGGKGGNGGKYNPPVNRGSCDDDPSQGGTIAGDPLSIFTDAVRGAAGQKGVQFASEYTSPSGATYYCTNKRFMDLPDGLREILDQAGLTTRGCAEIACLVEAFDAEGPAGIRGGSMRTNQVFSQSAGRAAEHGLPGTPCGFCQEVLTFLDIAH